MSAETWATLDPKENRASRVQPEILVDRESVDPLVKRVNRDRSDQPDPLALKVLRDPVGNRACPVNVVPQDLLDRRAQ